MIVLTIRILLTFALLIEVWLRAHWSVAALLTLMCITNEVQLLHRGYRG